MGSDSWTLVAIILDLHLMDIMLLSLWMANLLYIMRKLSRFEVLAPEKLWHSSIQLNLILGNAVFLLIASLLQLLLITLLIFRISLAQTLNLLKPLVVILTPLSPLYFPPPPSSSHYPLGP